MSKKITADVYTNPELNDLRSSLMAHWSGSDGTIAMFDDNVTFPGTDIVRALGPNENSHFEGVEYSGVYDISAGVTGASEHQYLFKMIRSNNLRALLPKADLLKTNFTPYCGTFQMDMTHVFGEFGTYSRSEQWPLPHHGLILIRVSKDLFIYANTQSLTNDDLHFIRDINVLEPPDGKFDSTTHHRARLEYSFGYGAANYHLDSQTALSDIQTAEVRSVPDEFHVLDNAVSDFLGIPLPFGNFTHDNQEFIKYLNTIANEVRHELRSDDVTSTAEVSTDNDFYIPLDDWLNPEDPISEFIVYRKNVSDKIKLKFFARAAASGIIGNITETIVTKNPDLEDHQQDPLFISIAEVPLSEHYSYLAIIHPTVSAVFNSDDQFPAYLNADTRHYPLRYDYALSQDEVKVGRVTKDVDTKIYKLKARLAYFLTFDSSEVRPRNRTVGQFNVWNEGANLLPSGVLPATPLAAPVTTPGKKNK